MPLNYLLFIFHYFHVSTPLTLLYVASRVNLFQLGFKHSPKLLEILPRWFRIIHHAMFRNSSARLDVNFGKQCENAGEKCL